MVYLVDLEDELAQLQALFLQFAADRRTGAAIGAAGRAYFEAHHAPETYAQGIVTLAEETALSAGQKLAYRRKADQQSNRATHPKLEERLKAHLTAFQTQS